MLAQTAGVVPDWSDADAILPIPYFRKRLKQRGFAPTVMIADALAGPWKTKVLNQILFRVKETEPQRGKSAAGRRKNVRGAFEARPDVSGMSVILVDDVMTTGATLDAAAQSLRAAGAKSIRCYTLARALLS